MLNSRGLGEQVQRKKEAYQSNPQALQQQYQQSQQLVDLLALQQLKSEKEAAARNMQMQMQQNPATIAQQREQEVLGMIKQEQGRKLGDVAQRTAGTLGQINKRTQQNMQRAAKQGLPSMGGPQRPAMMAGGGIVAFFDGGMADEFTEEEINAEIARLLREGAEERRGATASIGAAGSPKAEMEAFLQRQKARREDIAPFSSTKPELQARSRARRLEAAAQEKLDKRTYARPKTEALGGPAKPVTTDPVSNQQAGAVGAEGASGEGAGGVEQLGVGALPKSLTLETRTPDYTGTDAQRAAAKETFRTLGLDPTRTEEDVRKQRLKAVPEELGLESLSKTKESQLQRMRALQAQQTDPDKLRRERLTAGLLGAAGRGSTTLAGFGAGVFNQRRAQEAAATKNLTDQFGIENEKLELELEVAMKGVDSADRAAEVLQKEKIGMAEVMQKATSSDFEAADREAVRLQATDEANIGTTVSLIKQRNEASIAKAGRDADRVEALEEAVAASVAARLALSTPVVEELSLQLSAGTIDKNEYEQRLKVHQMAVLNLLDEEGVLDQEEDMLRELRSLGVDVSGSQASLEERRRLIEASRSKYLPKQS
jgi:hypothetical protein